MNTKETCEYCNRELPILFEGLEETLSIDEYDNHVQFAPNPYQWEIYDDKTPQWLCGRCRYDISMDI